MSVLGNILVADDDAAIRTVLNQALSRVGHQVRVTSNAATLWRWVAAGEGDLVITDVVMPDENAFDMIPRIRKARPELPVVVIEEDVVDPANAHRHDPAKLAAALVRLQQEDRVDRPRQRRVQRRPSAHAS